MPTCSLLLRNISRKRCEYIVIGSWIIILLSVHTFVWHKCSECDCPGSRDDTDIEYGSNDPRSVRADHPYRHGKGKSRRVLLPHQDPLRWRNEPEEIQGSFAVDNIEYGVNVVPSITKSIEGVSRC